MLRNKCNLIDIIHSDLKQQNSALTKSFSSALDLNGLMEIAVNMANAFAVLLIIDLRDIFISDEDIPSTASEHSPVFSSSLLLFLQLDFPHVETSEIFCIVVKALQVGKPIPNDRSNIT